MKLISFILPGVAFIWLVSGCISTETSGSGPIEGPVFTAQPSPDTYARSTRNQDTVTAQKQQILPRKSAPTLLSSDEDTLHASIRRRGPRIASKFELTNRIPPNAYTIQLGAFANTRNALRYQRAIKNAFPGDQLVSWFDSDNGLYKIGVGIYTVRKDAFNQLRVFKRSYAVRHPDAFVAKVSK